MRERLEVQNFLHFNGCRTERTANRNTGPVGVVKHATHGECVGGSLENTGNYFLGDLDLLRLSRISSLLWLLLPRLIDRERERLLLLLLLDLE